MEKGSSGFLGTLVMLALLVGAIYFWRASLVLVGIVIALGMLLWLGYRVLSKSSRAQASIDENDFATALRLLHESGRDDQLISALRFKMPFPNQDVKDRVVGAVRQLISLRDAAADPANTYLPESLRGDLRTRTHDSLSSLWPLCQKLSLLGRARLDEKLLKERLGDVTGQLEELATNAKNTRQQLALITLGASELEINHATEQVVAMKWQVNETQKFDALLES